MKLGLREPHHVSHIDANATRAGHVRKTPSQRRRTRHLVRNRKPFLLFGRQINGTVRHPQRSGDPLSQQFLVRLARLFRDQVSKYRNGEVGVFMCLARFAWQHQFGEHEAALVES